MAPHTGVAARRILVAAQDGIDRDILFAVLAGEGHLMVLAGDGAAAVDAVRGQPFDLVLLDMLLPAADALETLRCIRSLPGQAGAVPILALSASLDRADLEQQAAAGASASLSRTFDWDRILEAISRHAAATAPAAAPTAGETAEDPVLVDSQVLTRLGSKVGTDNLHAMVAMAIDAYDVYCDTMLQEGADPGAIGHEAHKLMGSAGTFGLRRISDLAGRITAALEVAEPVRSLLRQLKTATDQSRVELVRLGALPMVAAQAPCTVQP